MKNKRLSLIAILAAFVVPLSLGLAADRDILICTDPALSPALKKAVADFTAQAGEVPLFKALKAAGEYSAIAPENSEELLTPKQYDKAAHNHLVVIGLPSQDQLLAKVWGFTTTLDEANKTFYSEGWGYLQGDIGWIECDRNPFLHSRKIKSAPEGTILVKISGTSEAGILAALQAFQHGLLGGFVPAGSVTRPKTTLLDRMPDPKPAPATLPDTVPLAGGKTATLAGWYDIPEGEYRAIEEAAGVEPARMWRYKYLAPGILEEKSIVRWLGGIHRMAFGNAIDIIEFKSPEEAGQSVQKMVAHDGFKAVPDKSGFWMTPQAIDEVIDQPYWNIYLTSAGPYVFLSTLPPDAVTSIAAVLAK